MIPHLAFPNVTMQAVEAELARELEQRRKVYPGRVAKGNMTPAEADAEIAIAVAWTQDAWRIKQAWFIDHAPPAPATHGLTWNVRRNALLRELELRDRLYPQWIASGRLLDRHAAGQIAALRCLLAIYEDGFDWFGDDGLTPGRSELAAEQFATMRAQADHRQGRTQQELALP